MFLGIVDDCIRSPLTNPTTGHRKTGQDGTGISGHCFIDDVNGGDRMNLNRKINWDRYRELLDIPDLKIRNLLTEKILDGSVKSRDEIKQFKKLHLKSYRTRQSHRN